MSGRQLRIDEYLIEEEPYYLPTGDEVAIAEAAYQEGAPLLLKGPTGCGKTRFMQYLAWKLKRPLVTVSCHDDLSTSDLVGRYLIRAGEAVWTDGPLGRVSYGDVFHQNEVEMSTYNFEHANTASLFGWFDTCEAESQRLIELGLPLPAYEMTLKASHTFNLLDARKAISVTERQRYILRVRALARAVAQAYHDARAALGFPMCARQAASANRMEVAHG